MTTPHARPGFVSRNTDGDLLAKEKAPDTKERGLDTDVSKTEVEVDIQDGEFHHRPLFEEQSEDGSEKNAPVETAADLVTQIIHLDDDPDEQSLTFRTWFLGVGLSIFASVLQEIFYFKPQTIFVSLVFLTVIAYVLGDAMAAAIPRKGWLRHLNPHEFKRKEHAAITIMASAAAVSALATEALAAQELFYGGYPSKAAGIFIVLSSQLLGFGVAGLLREVIVYPTKMLWPMTLPVTTLLETIHRDKASTKRRMRVWYIVFFSFFVWEIFPEYIFIVLTGVSVVCLADQHNLVVTNLFGGASGNEGLGFLSLCFDWNYIAAFQSPLWYPLQTTVNMMIGIFGCYMLFMGCYYGNLWESQKFPFLSQSLFNATSTATNYSIYDQSLILTEHFTIDEAKLAAEGIPYLTGTYIAYLITSNAGLTATIVHMLLWNWDDLKGAWSWAHPRNVSKMFKSKAYMFWRQTETPEERLARKIDDPNLDPHYKVILRNKYKEVPLWWWGAVLVISWVIGIVCLYSIKSTLPGWGFVLALCFTFVFTLFFGAQFGITGFGFNIQPICQMLAGYLFPGRPLANFYFTCFTYNTTTQANLLAKDLRLAQQNHIPPRITFLLQVVGCLVGGIFSKCSMLTSLHEHLTNQLPDWVMMVSIVQNQGEILKSVQGTNIWSGQNIQQFNTLAIAWSIASKMFSVGSRYEWVTLAYLLGFLVPIPAYLAYRLTGNKNWGYINPSIILWYMGNLFVGINSSLTMFFIMAFLSQFYVRKYHPALFVKYNYLVSAAMDGGTQVMVFILTFAVAGGSGKAHPFPTWAGNPDLSVHNADYCMVNPANNG